MKPQIIFIKEDIDDKKRFYDEICTSNSLGFFRETDLNDVFEESV